jgi:hypothetical protein
MQKDKLGIDGLDTELLIQYVVRAEEYAEALTVIARYSHHPAAVNVFRNYYAELPEGREEMACDLRVVAEKQGAFIFALKTTAHHYLYFGSDKEVHYIGDYQQGINDEDILLYFGFEDVASFSKKIKGSFDQLEPLAQTSAASCVICGVATGEVHILGCPVEQCPWCDGQLNRCNCRFDQLGVEEMADEELLERFEEILNLKGRIVFKPEQSPSYPTAGNDPGPDIKQR